MDPNGLASTSDVDDDQRGTGAAHLRPERKPQTGGGGGQRHGPEGPACGGGGAAVTGWSGFGEKKESVTNRMSMVQREG